MIYIYIFFFLNINNIYNIEFSCWIPGWKVKTKKKVAPFKWAHAGLEQLEDFILSEFKNGRYKPAFPINFGSERRSVF